LNEDINGYDKVKLNDYVNRLYTGVYDYKKFYRNYNLMGSGQDFFDCLAMETFGRKYEFDVFFPSISIALGFGNQRENKVIRYHVLSNSGIKPYKHNWKDYQVSYESVTHYPDYFEIYDGDVKIDAEDFKNNVKRFINYCRLRSLCDSGNVFNIMCAYKKLLSSGSYGFKYGGDTRIEEYCVRKFFDNDDGDVLHILQKGAFKAEFEDNEGIDYYINSMQGFRSVFGGDINVSNIDRIKLTKPYYIVGNVSLVSKFKDDFKNIYYDLSDASFERLGVIIKEYSDRKKLSDKYDTIV
jgi:hypothetical protein